MLLSAADDKYGAQRPRPSKPHTPFYLTDVLFLWDNNVVAVVNVSAIYLFLVYQKEEEQKKEETPNLSDRVWGLINEHVT